MEIIGTLQKVTPRQLNEMESDFTQMLREWQSTCDSCAPTLASASILQNCNPLRATMNMAREAAASGDLRRGQFLYGMAAAFYGMARLADAEALEQELEPRLNASVAKETPTGQLAAQADMVISNAPQEFGLRELEDHFRQEGIRFRTCEADRLVMATFGGGRFGPIHLIGQLLSQVKALSLSFRLPLAATQEKKLEMSEAITRANYGLILGGFEMDMSDGEMNFKIAIPLDEASLSAAQLTHCLQAAFGTIECRLPAFIKVLYGAETTPGFGEMDSDIPF